jgi:hypothetical protein
MKKINLYGLLLFSSVLLINNGCTEEALSAVASPPSLAQNPYAGEGEILENPKEKIFKDIKWIFPWYNAVEIKDFNILIPQSIFKVYIQRDNYPQWEEVTPYSENLANTYGYFVETRPDGAGIYTYGSLYIFYYGSDTSDTPSVKIAY